MRAPAPPGVRRGFGAAACPGVAALCCALAACATPGPPPAPRTAGVSAPEEPRSAAPPRSAAEWAALDAAAVAELAGGFRTRVGGSGAAVMESAAGSPTLLHTLRLGEPAAAARWFGEAWEPAPRRVRRLSADGTATEAPLAEGAPWRVRLTGPAGFPLGDYLGAWTHGPAGASFTGRSAPGGGVRTPPVPGGGGGGGVWLPAATLRVEPTVGRWWIEDAAGRAVWSKASLPASVDAPADGADAFWAALADGIDRRLAAGPLRVAEEPWRVAFAAAERVRGGAQTPEAAAASALEAALRQ